MLPFFFSPHHEVLGKSYANHTRVPIQLYIPDHHDNNACHGRPVFLTDDSRSRRLTVTLRRAHTSRTVLPSETTTGKRARPLKVPLHKFRSRLCSMDQQHSAGALANGFAEPQHTSHFRALRACILHACMRPRRRRYARTHSALAKRLVSIRDR